MFIWESLIRYPCALFGSWKNRCCCCCSLTSMHDHSLFILDTQKMFCYCPFIVGNKDKETQNRQHCQTSSIKIQSMYIYLSLSLFLSLSLYIYIYAVSSEGSHNAKYKLLFGCWRAALSCLTRAL